MPAPVPVKAALPRCHSSDDWQSSVACAGCPLPGAKLVSSHGCLQTELPAPAAPHHQPVSPAGAAAAEQVFAVSACWGGGGQGEAGRRNKVAMHCGASGSLLAMYCGPPPLC